MEVHPLRDKVALVINEERRRAVTWAIVNFGQGQAVVTNFLKQRFCISSD